MRNWNKNQHLRGQCPEDLQTHERVEIFLQLMVLGAQMRNWNKNWNRGTL